MTGYATFRHNGAPAEGMGVESELRCEPGGLLHLAVLQVPQQEPRVRVLYIRALEGIQAGFALNPEQARALADELNRMADLAQGVTP